MDTFAKLPIAVLFAAAGLLAAGCDSRSDTDTGRSLQLASGGIATKSGEGIAGTDQSVEDSKLTTLVSEAISADRELQSQHIVVDADDGAVTLTGVVDSPALRERAIELAGLVDGVAQVQDRLKVLN